jgi:esterase/lipase
MLEIVLINVYLKWKRNEKGYSMSNITDLNKKIDLIKTLREKKSKLEGKKEQLLSDLLEKFKVKTLEEAQGLLTDKKNELEDVDFKINGLISEMDEIIEQAA